MKTTTILLLIAAAGLATGCRNNKDEDRYSYSDTAYRSSDVYHPSTTTSTTPTTTTTTAPRSMDSGATVWHSSTESQVKSQDNRVQNQQNWNQQKQGQNPSKQDAQIRAQDADFIKEAMIDGQKEVEMGRLAVRQGSNDRVRNFGQKLIDDHTKANDELTTLARQKNVNVSMTRTADDRSQLEKLAQLQGADFDKQFIDQIIQDHQRAIDLFDRESRTGEDAQVKAFAARTLPTLRSHLQMAKDIQTSLDATDLGIPRSTPSSTPRDPNQPIQPFDPNNPTTPPRNPNNPDPLNPTNPLNPNEPTSPSNPSNPNMPR